ITQDQAAQPPSPSPVSSYWNTDRIREWVIEETNDNGRTTTPIIVKECKTITKNDLVTFYRRFRGETQTSTSAAAFLYSNPLSSHHAYALDKYGKLIGFLFSEEKNKLLNNQQLLKITPIIDILIEPVYERRRLLYTVLKNFELNPLLYPHSMNERLVTISSILNDKHLIYLRDFDNNLNIIHKRFNFNNQRFNKLQLDEARLFTSKAMEIT
ncbi:unnamed protein product, partial [Didymodactylos carnosus]